MADGNGPTDTTGPDQSEDITSTHPTARHLRPSERSSRAGPDSRPLSATFPTEAHLPYEVVSYGPDIPDERVFRLLGNVEGKRILELGCGAGHTSIALAKQGAKVITVDPSSERLDLVRAAAEREEVKVELHHGDLAELAFVRADTIDVVVSIFALGSVEDLDRAFRQAHRVLRPENHLLFSIPHPAYAMIDPAADDPMRLVRTYWDRSARPWTTTTGTGADRPRTVSEIFTGLCRANFRVDTILEPEPAADAIRSAFWSQAMAWVPATLIVRARKEGI
ncbi:MAG: class I SAM-dependent methyltransferase [Acidimicrobiales bacterium]|nr:class I SAM-dependent methyltransferase [Acidimicrobiales bacterium]